jgi:hypothetical protein
MKKHVYGFAFLLLLIQVFPVAHAAKEGLVVKENCVWEHPGREPSEWEHGNALRALRVPEDTIKKFVVRIKNVQSDGWVDISPKQGIVRRQFGDIPERFTIDGMVFGKQKVCRRVSPAWADVSRKEGARLYVEQDKNGNIIYVAIPTVCNNITKLVLVKKPGLIVLATYNGPRTKIRADKIKLPTNVVTDSSGDPVTDSSGNYVTTHAY